MRVNTRSLVLRLLKVMVLLFGQLIFVKPWKCETSGLRPVPRCLHGAKWQDDWTPRAICYVIPSCSTACGRRGLPLTDHHATNVSLKLKPQKIKIIKKWKRLHINKKIIQNLFYKKLFISQKSKIPHKKKYLDLVILWTWLLSRVKA